MPGNSHLSTLPSFTTLRGPGLVDGTDLTKFFNLVLGSQSAITAGAGGGIPNAKPLSVGFNEITTVGTAADSVMLPAAVVNSMVWILNSGALSTNIYNWQYNAAANGAADVAMPHGSVTPNASNAAIALASGHATLFICSSLGRWKQIADFA